MTVKRMLFISLSAAILAISVYLLPPFRLPILNVSVTLQTLFIILFGFMFKPIDAFLSVFIYVLLGAFGLPIFSGIQGGFQVILGPTGGFIMLFPFVSLGISIFKSKDKNRIKDLSVGFIFSIVMLYIFGAMWLAFVIQISYVQALLGMALFIPFDILKLIIAYSVYKKLPSDMV